MTTDQTEQVRVAALALGGTSGRLTGLSACPGGPVLVMLGPGEEALAHRLWAQYGSHVSITVGLTTYEGSPGRSPVCGVVQPSSPLPAGLHLALHLKTRTVRSGSFFDANVVITEMGPNTFFMDTGQPLDAVVVRPRTHQVVGVFSGAIGGTGYGQHLSPGQSETIPVIGGTARCDGGVGSALPPGNFQVTVQVAPETTPRSPAYLTPPVPLRVSRT
jgi:hypothetical protein